MNEPSDYISYHIWLYYERWKVLEGYLVNCSNILEGVDQFSRVFDEEEHLEVKPVQVTAQVEVLLVVRLIRECFSHQL